MCDAETNMRIVYFTLGAIFAWLQMGVIALISYAICINQSKEKPKENPEKVQ
jgi:hypothetical protein